MSDYYYNQDNNTYETLITGNESSAPNRGLAIICYCFSWIGFIIALIGGDRTDPYFRHHINQALVINLFSLIGVIPIIGWIWDVFMFVILIFSLVSAVKENTDPVPVFGKIHLL